MACSAINRVFQKEAAKSLTLKQRLKWLKYKDYKLKKHSRKIILGLWLLSRESLGSACQRSPGVYFIRFDFDYFDNTQYIRTCYYHSHALKIFRRSMLAARLRARYLWVLCILYCTSSNIPCCWNFSSAQGVLTHFMEAERLLWEEHATAWISRLLLLLLSMPQPSFIAFTLVLPQSRSCTQTIILYKSSGGRPQTDRQT